MQYVQCTPILVAIKLLLRIVVNKTTCIFNCVLLLRLTADQFSFVTFIIGLHEAKK